MRFPRHDGIYRSDVSFLLINPAQMPPPDGRPRCRAIGRDGRSTPCPSSAMSSGQLFLDRVGRHQSPSPLHRHPQHKAIAASIGRIYHRAVASVLTGCLSRGDHPKALEKLSSSFAGSSLRLSVLARNSSCPEELRPFLAKAQRSPRKTLEKGPLFCDLLSLRSLRLGEKRAYFVCPISYT